MPATALPDATPLTLPLPGGSTAAGVVVHPLVVATMPVPPSFFDRRPGNLGRLMGLGLQTPRSRWLELPVPAFLIEHPTAGPLLVDTALDALAATDPRGALGRRTGTLFKIRMRPEHAVPAQLRARGIEPGDIAAIVMTHLHYDHASGLAQLPRTKVICDAVELEHARKGRFVDGYRKSLLAPHHEWLTLDMTGADPHGAFAHAIDLLGDGSVRLLATPGHSAGHMSVLLRLAGGGELLLTGDAAYARRTIDQDLLPVFGWNEALYRESLARLRTHLADNPETQVICGHDAWLPLPERCD